MKKKGKGSPTPLTPEVITRVITHEPELRTKALLTLLARTGVRISEAVKLEESGIDFKGGILTIIHQKERVRLKCPHCGELLGKKHFFCPKCGSKVGQATREKVEQRKQRTIPVDQDTLQALHSYLKWKREHLDYGELVFPITRTRGWQLVEESGRRAGVYGLHPHKLRHFLATTWVSKGLDTKKLQMLLGHASIATTMEYVDTNLEQLKSEYDKLWG